MGVDELIISARQIPGQGEHLSTKSSLAGKVEEVCR